MNALMKLQHEYQEAMEAVNAELAEVSGKIGAMKKQIREIAPPTTSAGRAKRRDMQEELEELQKIQDRINTKRVRIPDKYVGNIQKLQHAMGQLQDMQQRFDERVAKKMWLEYENPDRLVREMRPLAKELEVDLDSWLAQYDYEPKSEPAPTV